MNDLISFTGLIAGWLWGVPALVVLVGTGLWLSIKLRAIQLRGFKHACQLVSGRYDANDAPGQVSHFQALSTALSATVGTGNIAGVATAIALGGPGAVFWMWITALVGMATKYTSCTLALRYRQLDANGDVAGGPMYTLKYGLKRPRLAAAFALFTLIASFGIGNMVQANSVVDGLRFISPSASDYAPWIGALLALLVGLVVLGGIGRIARTASILVPVMALLYCGAALTILALHWEQIPSALATIFNLALNPWAAGGGAIGAAIQYGVARGVFSNEAGLGSAPIAHAAARTQEPCREGLVAMLGPFIDTLVICSMTALVIVISGAWGDQRPDDFVGAALSAHAFSQGLAPLGEVAATLGGWIVGVGLVFFAFSTMIAWCYYGDRCAKFLWHDAAILPYRLVFVALVWVGATTPLQLVWNFSDIANMLMAVPNLISLLLLAHVVQQLTDDYFQRSKAL